MHTHLFLAGEEAGMMQLAAGITSVRDVASDIDAAVSQRDRANLGTMLSPRIILAGFIEGPGKWAGPTDVLVRTEDEARAWVARYDSLGYKQIKLYNLVHPDLVPVIAEEAHKRGMRLSGHIPRGLTVQSAVRLGYDEFQHAAYLFSTFFQDSLYVPRMRAYSEVANTVAPTFDVNAPQVTELKLVSPRCVRQTVDDGAVQRSRQEPGRKPHRGRERTVRKSVRDVSRCGFHRRRSGRGFPGEGPGRTRPMAVRACAGVKRASDGTNRARDGCLKRSV
jgi:hypothetical protein